MEDPISASLVSWASDSDFCSLDDLGKQKHSCHWNASQSWQYRTEQGAVELLFSLLETGKANCRLKKVVKNVNELK